MLRIRLSFLSVVIYLTLSPVWAAPGFYNDWSKFPQGIRDARKSVFRIFVLRPEIEFLVPREKRDEYASYVKENFKHEQLLWKQIEIQDADSKGIVRTRKIVSTSTAFLIKDRKTLVMARHSFTDIKALPAAYFTAETTPEAVEAVRNYNPEIVLLDDDNKIVFDSRKKRAEVKFGFEGHPTRVDQLGSDLAKYDLETKEVLLDFVELKLDQELEGVPLELAPEMPNIDDSVYVISFPASTLQSRLALDAPDADGTSQRVSFGIVKPAPQNYLTFLEKISPSSEAKSYFLASRIFTNADAVRGSSGAPILDSKGRLVGIYSMHWKNGKEPLESAYFDGGGHGVAIDFAAPFL